MKNSMCKWNNYNVIVLLFSMVFHLNGEAQSGASKEELMKTYTSLLKEGSDIYRDEPDKAILLYKEADLIARQLNDDNLRVDALNGLGLSSGAKSDYANSFHYYDETLKLLEGTENYSMISAVNNNLGVIYESLGLYDLALEYYLNAEKDLYKSNTGNKLKFLNNTLENIALIHKFQGNYEEALLYLDKSLNVLKEVKDISESERIYRRSRGLMEYGMVHLKQGNIEKAEPYLKENISLIEVNGNESDKALGFYYMGEFYAGKENYEEALNYTKMANGFVSKTDQQNIKRDIYLLLAKLYEMTDDIKSAHCYFKKYTEIDQDFFGIQNTWRIYKIDQDYKLASQEQAYEVLNKEKEINRMMKFFYALIALTIAIVAFFTIKGLRNKHKKEREQIEREKKQTEDQLKQAKINLELKQKELTTATLQIIEKGESLQQFKSDLIDLKKDLGKAYNDKIDKLYSSISNNSHKNWEEFKVAFEKVNDGFFDKIKQTHTSLTANDLKLCSFLKLNLTSKDISNLMGISTESVKMSRYRLRKKLDLPRETNLVDFINRF